MPRRLALLALLALILAAALLTAAVAGRFTPLTVLTWAVFFGSMFWPYLRDPSRLLECRRRRA